ncbi:M20 family metallopeptidase [Candidatus Woesearchaeota archaeon]|nr:M20 family metallopeptidase [Candidatus Woesearchaeota archaeon]
MEKGDEILNLTMDLIRFKSVKSNPDELKRIIDFVAHYLKRPGVSVKRFVRNQKHSAVFLPKGVKRPKLLLVCHADVVEADDEDFIPRLKGNRLYGRGSYDMKAGLAIAMTVMKRYAGSKSVGLMVTTDEEIGGADGAGFLAKKYSADLVIACEPSELTVELKEKGMMVLKLVARGKACHGAYQWLGRNAADELIKAYLKVRKKIPLLKKESWKTSMNLGMMSAGPAPNIVPGRAEMTLDIRFTEHLSPDRILKMIRSCLPKSVSLEVLKNEPMMVTRQKTPEMKMFYKAYQAVLGKKPVETVIHGATDARHFSNQGIPSMIFGFKGDNPHAKNEYANIPSIEKCYEIYEEFVKGL